MLRAADPLLSSVQAAEFLAEKKPAQGPAYAISTQ